MLSVGLKAQKSILAGALPPTQLGSLHCSPIPYSWWGGELAAPLPKYPTPDLAFRASNFSLSGLARLTACHF